MFNFNSKKGFTLVEIAIASVIFFIVLGVFRFTTQISWNTLQDRNRIKADNFAQQLLEETKADSGENFETLETLSSTSITRPEFPNFIASRSIGAIKSSGEREVRVVVSWQEGSTIKQSDYYLKMVKSSAPSVGGTVNGYVKDNIGNPIKGATVWACGFQGSEVTTTTDINGFFNLTNVQIGKQPISSQKLGSSPTNSNFEQGYYNKNAYSWSKSVDVVVKSSEVVGAPDIVLDPLGSITGKITDINDDAPIDKINVHVYFTWGTQTQWWTVSTDISNPIGPYNYTYLIRNVRPPEKSVNYYWGYTGRKNGSPCTVQPSASTFEWGYCESSWNKVYGSAFLGNPPQADFSTALMRFGWLTGKIVDASIMSNPPVKDAIVEARPAISSSYYSLPTDSFGNYAFYNICYNDYSNYPYPFYASKTGYLKSDKSISLKRNQANVCDIKLYPSDWVATVIGTVWIDEGAGAPRLANENEVEISAEKFDSWYMLRTYTYAKTKADGTYELNNVKPNFNSGEKRSITFRLLGGIKGDIIGYVYEDKIGIGLADADVSCYTDFGSYKTKSSSTYGITGFYELKDIQTTIAAVKDEYLPPDEPPPDKVQVDCTLAASKTQLWVYGSKSGYYSTSKKTDLIKNGTTNLDLILTKQNICSISGTVTDSKNGKGVANIKVSSGGRYTTTNSSGNYSLSYVPIPANGIVNVATDSTNDYESGSTSRSGVKPGDILTNVDIVINPKSSGM